VTEASGHRASRRIVLLRSDLLAGAGVCLASTAAWLLAVGTVCRAWRRVLAGGVAWLGLEAAVVPRPVVVGGLRLELPSIEMASLPPSAAVWWSTAVLCVVLLALASRLPESWTPIAYLLRLAVGIQVVALVYFALIPARFPHGASAFLGGSVTGGAVIISLVPATLGVIYYTLGFGWRRNLALTLLTMAHLAVLVPLQALLHAYVLSYSLLFMPVLFLFFGMPVEILVLVSFYSWGVSWTVPTRFPERS
jgi:hypothetical protein